MANIDNPGLDLQTAHSGSWGNKSVINPPPFIPGAAVIGDVLRIARIKAGSKISPAGFTAIITAAFTTGVTASFGFEYVPSEEVTKAKAAGTIADDPDFFVKAGQSLAAIGIVRGNKEINALTLDHDVYITATLAGANNASTTASLDLWLDYIFTGLK